MWRPAADRYDAMTYRRCGRSGLFLPRIVLGMWWNFGDTNPYEAAREMVRTAFDLGVTHFDLANNYGPPPGAAETTFGRLIATDLKPYRDEIVVSTKAGFTMWPGPYGDGGSRKYLLASLDQSLARMGLEYVDIFYSHRFDPETPLEETMGGLADAVRSGKALYAGISSYPAAATVEAAAILRRLGVPAIVHQAKYSALVRGLEGELLDTIAAEGMGCVVYSPLAQGMLTDAFVERAERGALDASPRPSRPREVAPELLARLQGLRAVAQRRGQTLAELAQSFVLRDQRVTSAIIGASCPDHVRKAVAVLAAPPLSPEGLAAMDGYAPGP